MPNEAPEKRENEFARRGHELRDVSVKGLGYFALGFVICGILMQIALYFYYSGHANFFHRPHAVIEAKKSNIDRHRDLVSFQKQEEIELNSYGWIDREKGVVRIPIERAMEILVKRGFPVRTASSKNERTPLELQRERAAEK